MNEEFINIYIETLSKKNEDLNRNEIMLISRLMIAEKLIASLEKDKTDLQEQLDKLNVSLNKKALKSKEDF